MRLLVTGDREWRDAPRVRAALMDWIIRNGDPVECGHTLITGDAKGADMFADAIGQLFGFEIERYPAEWKRYGNPAGPIRNQQMLDTGVDDCLAFHDDLGASRGTKDMIEHLEKAGIPYTLVGNDTRET